MASERVRRIGIVHAAANGTGALLFAGSLLARAAGSRGRGKLLALAGMGAVGAGGWLGGHLSYAEGVGVDVTVFEDYPGDWTPVIAESELVEGEPHRAEVDGVPVVVVRSGGAGVRAGRPLLAPRRPAQRRRGRRRLHHVPVARLPLPARRRLGRARARPRIRSPRSTCACAGGTVEVRDRAS